jgi:hypothetical protein
VGRQTGLCVRLVSEGRLLPRVALAYIAVEQGLPGGARWNRTTDLSIIRPDFIFAARPGICALHSSDVSHRYPRGKNTQLIASFWTHSGPILDSEQAANSACI